MTQPPRPLPDAAARERIRRDLGASLLIEAAAGTGKTTSLVERMVELPCYIKAAIQKEQVLQVGIRARITRRSS